MFDTCVFVYVVIQHKFDIHGLYGCLIVMLQEYHVIQPKIWRGICVRND